MALTYNRNDDRRHAHAIVIPAQGNQKPDLHTSPVIPAQAGISEFAGFQVAIGFPLAREWQCLS